MQKKIMLKMISIVTDTIDCINTEVDKEDFFKNIKEALQTIGGIEGYDILITPLGAGKVKFYHIMVDMAVGPCVEIEVEELDETGIKIISIAFVSAN